MTAIQWTLLLATLTICDCQVQSTICIKPDKCPQEKCCSYPPPDCMTLSEYVLMNTSGIMNSRLELSPGEYYLNSTFSINGTSTQNFSIIGNDSESIVIMCTQKDAVLKFNGLSFLAINNVSFVSCGVDKLPGVSLTNINTVNLVNTSFSKSTSGALDIQNCSSVHLTDLMIVNNSNSQSTIVNITNSKNITIKRNLCIENNSIKIADSSCDRNKVVFGTDGGAIFAEKIQVSKNKVPYGALFMTNAVITVDGNWTFEDNEVCNGSLAFGNTTVNFNGALSFVNNKGSNNNKCECTSCLMLRNKATLIIDGSLNLTDNHDASYAVYLRTSILTVAGSLTAHNNFEHKKIFFSDISSMSANGTVSFFNNSCTPIALYSATLTISERIKFERNAGILYALKSHVFFSGNAVFTSNDADDDFIDGALALVGSTLNMKGMYKFEDTIYYDKNGGGIYASALSKVILSDTGYFMNNTANNGGGIFIDQLSRLELNIGTRLYFIKNTAVRGAGIFISTSLQHTQCQSNPNECLFGLEDDINPNVSLVFQHNKANPGASVIHVNFDQIEEDQNVTYPALNNLNSTVNDSSFTGNSLPLYDSNTYNFCFCDSNSKDICWPNGSIIQTVPAYKGKTFHIQARVHKFYGYKTSEQFRAYLKSSQSTATLTVNDGKLKNVNANECTNLKFTVKSMHDNETLVIKVSETFLGAEKSLEVNIAFNESCPSGFPLNKNNDSCECDESIKNFLKNCEITDEAFEKRTEYTNYWMAPSKNSTKMSWYSNCPNRYCITDENFTFSENSSICANGRSGLLCGQCEEDLSLLLGGDLCGDCSGKNAYLALILVFAAAGVLLIAFIFLTQITVTTGTINGLIFYANILNSNQAVFFPEGFFPGYCVFISWLNLNFGIETCFFNRMDQLQYSGLQFAFPLYLWLLAGIIVLLCHFSMRVAKFFGSSDPVAVLATIVLLSFNSLVQNIIGIFYFSNLNLPDNKIMSVWRYDGNIIYSSREHLTLLLVSAAFVLIFVLPYALVLFSAPLLQKNERISKILLKMKLQPFIHTYLVPFKPRHRYWMGLCLLMRAFLLICFAYGEERRVNLLLIAVACVVAISMFSITGGIYDKSWMDKLEVSFFINLGVLAAATSYSLYNCVNEQQEIATYISITVALLTFIGIVILHIFWQLRKFKVVKKWAQKIFENIKSFKKRKSITNESVRFSDIDDSVNTMKATSQVVDLREPLLESLHA